MVIAILHAGNRIIFDISVIGLSKKLWPPALCRGFATKTVLSLDKVYQISILVVVYRREYCNGKPFAKNFMEHFVVFD